MNWIFSIYILISLLATIDYAHRYGKAKKEIEYLRKELEYQINENLKYKNNFSTDSAE